MSLEEMVEKFGEVRITKVSQFVMLKSIVNNQVIETPGHEVHYRVQPRDAEPGVGSTLAAAMEGVK